MWHHIHQTNNGNLDHWKEYEDMMETAYKRNRSDDTLYNIAKRYLSKNGMGKWGNDDSIINNYLAEKYDRIRSSVTPEKLKHEMLQYIPKHWKI